MKPLRSILAWSCYLLAGAGGLLVAWRGILVYFIRTTPHAGQTGFVHDGLGRDLIPTPLWIRIMFRADSMWPGLWPSALDLCIFIGGSILCYAVFAGGIRLRSQSTKS